MQTQLVIIQPTSFCNINCRYCYLPDRIRAKRISQETLERIFKVLFASPFVFDKVAFAWHAGEPLVLPTGFYERAFQLQQKWNKKNVSILNAFQTNATLITQKWCRFFQEHAIHVGVSLDGPQDIHDAHRVDRAGRGTFERAMCGIELLREYDIPYTVISVITKESLEQPDQFWHFFSELSPLSVGLNPEEVEGVNNSSSLSTEEDIQHYKAFLERLLLLNEHQSRSFLIREIESLMSVIRSSRPSTYAQTNVPLAILSFDCDGNFSTFSPELLTISHPAYGNFHLGNVHTDALEDICANPKFQRMQAEIQQGIQQCKESCPYFAVCGGGSPSNKLYENGTFCSTETVACRLRIQVFTDVLLEHLEEKYYLPSCPQTAPG